MSQPTCRTLRGPVPYNIILYVVYAYENTTYMYIYIYIYMSKVTLKSVVPSVLKSTDFLSPLVATDGCQKITQIFCSYIIIQMYLPLVKALVLPPFRLTRHTVCILSIHVRCAIMYLFVLKVFYKYIHVLVHNICVLAI